MRRTAAAIALAMLATFPMDASAAVMSPQKALESAVKQGGAYVPLRQDGTFSLTFVPGPKPDPMIPSKIAGEFFERFISRDAKSPKSEGRFSARETMAAGTAAVPLSISWKSGGGKTYFRVDDVPQAVMAFIAATGADPSSVIGKWISFASPEQKKISDSLAKALSAGGSNPFDLKGKRYSVLQFLGTEKTWKQADGVTVSRVKARINPLFIADLKKEMAAAGLQSAKYLSGSYKKSRQAKTARDIAMMRRTLSQARFAVEVDRDHGTMKRLEAAGTASGFTKACPTTADPYKDCPAPTVAAVQYALGITFK